MISMEEAVTNAFSAYHRLYSSGASAKDALLEELEPTSDGLFWDVTIGFNTVETALPSQLELAMSGAGGGPSLLTREKVMRRYKLFRIDANTGELASMRMKDA